MQEYKAWNLKDDDDDDDVNAWFVAIEAAVHKNLENVCKLHSPSLHLYSFVTEKLHVDVNCTKKEQRTEGRYFYQKLFCRELFNSCIPRTMFHAKTENNSVKNTRALQMDTLEFANVTWIFDMKAVYGKWLRVFIFTCLLRRVSK